MDEIQMVRSLYADPPAPTRHEMTVARRRIDALARPRRSKRARWAVGGFGLVAGAAAAATVATQLGTPGTVSKSSPPVLSARQVLLTAADSAATASFSNGKYWFVETTTEEPSRIQGKGGSYLVESTQGRRDWTYAHGRRYTVAQMKSGHAPTVTDYFGDRDLGTKPVGAANIAAWKRDGSPTHWTIPVLGGGPRETVGLDMKAKPWAFHRQYAYEGTPFGDETFQELQALPTDPTRLRASFMKQRTSMDDTRQDWQTDEQWLFEIAGSLLEKEPAPPKVRAAAFKVLAGLRTAHSAGAVTDPLGRKGNAVEMQTEPGHAHRYMIDPATGRMLADEEIATDNKHLSTTGAMEYWEALVTADFTNTVPANAPEDH